MRRRWRWPGKRRNGSSSRLGTDRRSIQKYAVSCGCLFRSTWDTASTYSRASTTRHYHTNTLSTKHKIKTNHPERTIQPPKTVFCLGLPDAGTGIAMCFSIDRGRTRITVPEVDETTCCTGMEEQDDVHHAVVWSGLVWFGLVWSTMATGLLGCDAPLQGMDGCMLRAFVNASSSNGRFGKQMVWHRE